VPAYDWSQRGDEWSDAWGGVSHQWWTTLFVRIQGYLPASRILEIAPGYGRWTHFLNDLCDELIIVDIAEAAIADCRERFAAEPHIRAHVNDGTSLAMVAAHRLSTQYPPSRRELRFGVRSGADPGQTQTHTRARELLPRGHSEAARDMLRDQVRHSLDPDTLNDLAVLTMQCGDTDAAIDLLSALVRLHPEDITAAQNLAVLLARSRIEDLSS
jgi:Methyltransferase domain